MKSKNKVKLIIIITVCIAAAIALWHIGYAALKDNHYNTMEKGVFQIVQEHMENDEYFIDTYGTPVLFEQDKENKMQQIDEKTCYIWLYVENETGVRYSVKVKFTVTGYQVEYEEITVVEE